MAGDDEASLRGVRSWPQGAVLERRLLDAVLECVGERGYGETTLEAVVRRARSSNRGFHRHFEDLDACFAKAYGLAAEELCVELIAVGRAAGSWCKGLRAALERFLAFASERPGLARVILLEYRFAGEQAVATHNELLARICEELDSVRAKMKVSDEPPQIVARTLVGGIEFTIGHAILSEAEIDPAGMVEKLGFFVTMFYLGADAAKEEFG